MIPLINKSAGYKVIKISEFLSKKEYSDKKLVIPVYQRPYRWTAKNIVDLLSDLYYQCKRIGHRLDSPDNPDNFYRLGTVVLHQHANKGGHQTKADLVDGQQRTLTLLLIMKSAIDSNRFTEQFDSFTPLEIELPDCSETQKNLSKNYEIIRRYVHSPEFTSEVLDFLLNHCEVVQVTLHDLSEAFQFFDSQNARGLDLNPHDLLKAFHLREFPDSENLLKQNVVESWEQQNTKSLEVLFANYLYPIRRWSLGKQAVHFSKSEVNVFKGMKLDSDSYPFQENLRIVHNTVDSYNHHSHRLLDQQVMVYPFQLNQTLINGRRFFEWVAHYQKMIQPLLNKTIDSNSQEWLYAITSRHHTKTGTSIKEIAKRPTAFNIFLVLNTDSPEYAYKGRSRRGDQYVRRMFDALVLCYYDRFGGNDLPRAIEYIFIWAYSLRLEKKSVYLESIEKYIGTDNLFERLQQALSSVDFLSKPLPQPKKVEATNVEGIKELFAKLGYLPT